MPEERRRGESGHASPAQVAQALGGIDFPKRKQELRQYAREHNKDNDPDVLDVLDRIPDREYGSMADVERGVSEAE